MRKELNPGRERKCITMLDNIVFSTVKDKEGKTLELHMSLVLQHGNVESRLANGLAPDGSDSKEKKPVILMIPGGGYRGSDKNLMVPEMIFLAEAGFALAFMYYRGSGEGVFPAQIIDVKTAVRFLRANAEKYGLDPDHIGAMGRSAGGHLAALAGMNREEFISKEWPGYSSDVQAVCDWFGPVDVPYCIDMETEAVRTRPDYRWKRVEDTHPGALMGGDLATMKERAKKASPPYLINEKVCPILIMHGDKDRHVPARISEDFYEKLVEAGFGEQTDYYLVKNGDHGSDEFFQPETKKIVKEFFEKYLK